MHLVQGLVFAILTEKNCLFLFGNNIDVDPGCLCNVIPTERSDETLVRQCLQQLVTRSAGEVCAV